MGTDELHAALETLRPTDFASIPILELSAYLQNVFRQAHLIASSIPPTPGGADEPCSSLAKPTGPVNFATSAKEMRPSTARPPPPDGDELLALQKHWGKPLKVGAKDNPLGVTVWKMAGHDRHGAWFARKSVHEGLGFGKWKRAMKREFATSRAVEGGPGAGAVRGIGADRLVTREEVPGVGKLEVWHLSAQFPGPVTPREFLTMLLTSEDDSAGEGGRVDGGRTYIMVSIPVEHDDAPTKSGMVRGSYESVEMIREIPIIPSPAKSKDGQNKAVLNAGAEDADCSGDPELNPVEWMMITRSDPGGGIPRFMVERSTPASITADTAKFLDWAIKVEDVPSDHEEDVEAQEKAEGHTKTNPDEFVHHPSQPNAAALVTVDRNSAPGVPTAQSISPELVQSSGDAGILASLTGAVTSSIAAYTPNPVLEHLPTTLFTSRAGQEAEATHYKGMADDDDDDDDSSTSDLSSVDSFESAMPYRTAEEDRHRDSASSSSTENPLASKSDQSLGLALGNTVTGGSNTPDSTRTGGKHEEKELRKLLDRKKELDKRFAARVEKDAKKREQMAQRSTRDTEKKLNRISREERKTADRYARDMAKIEQRQRKEERRLEARKRKQEDKDRLSKAERERDEAGLEAEKVRAENEGLKGQVGELQRELTILVREMGRLAGGAEVLNAVREEMAAGMRPGSPASERSRKSKASFDGRRESVLSNH